ncbi:MAG: transferrin-binding protein-like solute binding protein [Sphingomonas sp.]
MSESFTNDAMALNGSFLQYPSQCSCTAGSNVLQIFYDAVSQGYTVTSGGISQTFLPGDISSSQSTLLMTVYEKIVGGVTDSLALTNPGTSGPLTYQYVGAGAWQRTTAVPDPGGVSARDHVIFDYKPFTYGVVTPDSALPRIGSAGFTIDLIGTLGGETVTALHGRDSVLTVNFASGVIATSGILDEYSATQQLLASHSFGGSAQLSSSTNAFAGTFGFDDLSGGLNGRFYGPGAEEVGAVWTATNPDGRAATGTIIGRQDASVPLSSGRVPAPDDTQPLVVSYDAASQSYSLTAGGQALTLTGADRDPAGSTSAFDLFRKTLADGSTLDAQIYNAAGSPLALSYTSFAELVFRGTDGTTRTSYQPFGQRTAASDMPRTGSASYNGAIYGQGSVQGAAFSAFYSLGGTSRLDVDFASNRASGSLAITGANAAGTRDFGSFAFQSYAMSGGQFSATASGANASGTVNGAFYGPGAQEFGAGFAIKQGAANGDTTTLTGVTIGKKAP